MQNKIYVGNLAYTVTDDELRTTFSQFGDIESANVISDRYTGRSKGFGFVTFGTDAAAQESLTLDGQDLGGRNMKVNIAREKTEGGDKRRSGGGAGGAGGRW